MASPTPRRRSSRYSRSPSTSRCRSISRCPAATRESAPPSTSTAIVPRASLRPRWGGGSTRMGCFSARLWLAVPCLQRRSMSFERVGSEEVWSGRIATVRNERYRHEDGEVVDREVVSHPGAVAVVAHDGEHLWLVRQPREAVGR